MVIDACVFPNIFHVRDDDFAPVFEWVVNGDGKFVIGGTKFLMELGRMRKYSNLVKILKDKGKIVSLKRTEVDNMENLIRSRCNDSDFDDAHLIAIIDISKSKIICTNDSRADKYIKKKELYLSSTIPPKIYRNKEHAFLLIKENLPKCCLPSSKLPKADKTVISKSCTLS